jgi:Tfp pilus assembly protein PilF/predicted Ser/Thr protein kinase
MSDSSPQVCRQCATPLPADAPGGLCPRCLMARIIEPTHAGEPAATLPPLEPGEIAPHFPQLDILDFLGRGGMGVVYKARQKSLNRLVALKLLAPERAGDPQFAARFEKEAQALAALSHPNIVAVYDFGRAGGFYYLLMEHVDGVNLRQLLKTRRLSPREALAIVPPICDALQCAHDHGIVHRDIKPENLLMHRGGAVKIADFGIAKMIGDRTHETQTSGAGTPDYAAPEQRAASAEVDHRADIYSLGVVLYEMLTGDRPAEKIVAPSKRVLVDVRIDEVVLRALEPAPERRYQTAAEMRTQVETVSAPPSPQPAATGGWGRMVKMLAIAFLSFVVAVIAVWITYMVLEEPRATESTAAKTQRGWQLWQSGKPEQALPIFRDAVKRTPDDANTWNGLGWAALNSGHPEEAMTAFRRALAVEPNHMAALNGVGQVHLARREYAEAEAPFLKAAPQGASASWYGLARLYLLQGKFPEAAKYAQMLEDSGQADAIAKKMLEAAKARSLSDGLRATIEPPEPATTTPKPQP